MTLLGGLNPGDVYDSQIASVTIRHNNTIRASKVQPRRLSTRVRVKFYVIVFTSPFPTPPLFYRVQKKQTK